MFGKYNDSILKKIGNRYKDNNIKGLKKDIKEYVTLIKEDKNLNEFILSLILSYIMLKSISSFLLLVI